MKFPFCLFNEKSYHIFINRQEVFVMLKEGFHGFCMALAVLILSSLFESHIYVVSSLFIGFIAGSIPLILTDERPAFRQMRKGLPFGLIGILLVVGITWLNSQSPTAAVDLGTFSLPLAIRLFFTGMIAISAMFLPGISDSTLLLILGAYLPVITAIKGLLSLQLIRDKKEKRKENTHGIKNTGLDTSAS